MGKLKRLVGNICWNIADNLLWIWVKWSAPNIDWESIEVTTNKEKQLRFRIEELEKERDMYLEQMLKFRDMVEPTGIRLEIAEEALRKIAKLDEQTEDITFDGYVCMDIAAKTLNKIRKNKTE